MASQRLTSDISLASFKMFTKLAGRVWRRQSELIYLCVAPDVSRDRRSHGQKQLVELEMGKASARQDVSGSPVRVAPAADRSPQGIQDPLQHQASAALGVSHMLREEQPPALHEPSQILDLDVNGLYAATMREALPVSDFEWMTKDEIACLNIDDVPDDAPTGYILG
ncbi:hypothetical protein HPB47_004309 [Ixodes persulcatus]|uniref:Uncharacterized protein n=1 Tax=Ixodes persulcatus TaxID=34615 RepID=A0AC60PG81_IXOPE|nr:hypothetical protein HPB47_004309 [Ixodes persulcatus]